MSNNNSNNNYNNLDLKNQVTKAIANVYRTIKTLDKTLSEMEHNNSNRGDLSPRHVREYVRLTNTLDKLHKGLDSLSPWLKKWM